MALLAPAIACVVAVPAQAADPAVTITQTVRIGQDFWHARGVQPCPAPEVLIVDLEGDEGGEAELGGCRLWLDRQLVSAAARERWRPHVAGDSMRLELCTTVVHELGHTAGLGHTSTGIMSPVTPVGGTPPWECRVWQRGLERAERARAALLILDPVCHVSHKHGLPGPDNAWNCTPGSYNRLTRHEACTPKDRPSLPAAERREITTEYGVPDWTGRNGELDHRIPVWLGGRTESENIWPEPGAIPNAKDRLEYAVYRRVCFHDPHGMRVRTARRLFLADWRHAYLTWKADGRL